MYHVPAAPQTLVTREIVCICCQERFTISVDVPDRQKKQTLSNHWHVPADRFSTTLMRFTQQQQQRPITPQPLAQPAEDPRENISRDPRQRYHINCPRCGADNRNWLNALNRGFPLNKAQWTGAFLVLFIFLLSWLFVFRIGERQSVYLALSILFAGWLPLYIIPRRWSRERIYHYLTTASPKLRKKIPPHWWPSLTVLFIFALLLPAIRYVAFPAVGWLAHSTQPEPTVVERIDEISTTENFNHLENLYGRENQPVINAYTSLANQLNEKAPDCNRYNIGEQLLLLETAKSESPDYYTYAITRLREGLNTVPAACQKEVLTEALSVLIANGQHGIGGAIPCTGPNCANDNVVVDAMRDLQTLINELPDETALPTLALNAETANGRQEILQKARQTALTLSPNSATAQTVSNNLKTMEQALIKAQPPPPVIDWKFLVAWFVTVFLAWILGAIAANMAMGNHIKIMDPHLPHPIFTNITDMTRLAIWELRRTLEAEEYIHQIQWMQAERCDDGGIKLVGLHRGLPEFNIFGRSGNEKIRAQQYEINTNPWVKITRADIKDVEVAPTINTPAFVTAVETWPRNNGGPTGDGGGGGNTNGGFVLDSGPILPRPPNPVQTASNIVPETAVAPQNINASQQPQTQEAAAYVPPPIYLRLGSNEVPSNSHSGELTAVQVSQLSQKICAHFNLTQLRNFCFELDVDYDQLPGNDKRAKTKALIRTFSRHHMISDLLNALQIKRPSFNWNIVG